jgi:IS605 OrfB family transposase
VKVAVPFVKKIKEVKHKRVVGMDAGITDLLYSSDGQAYGTFTGMSAFYEKVVEAKTGQRAKLRSVMSKHQKELKSCTNGARKEVLRTKIQHIASQLNQTNNLDKCRRKYAHEVDVRLNQTVKTFYQDIKKQPVLVSMESLDIDEFDRGKKANKRDSSWIRGQLLTKLQEVLTWNGVPFVEVDPGYTSKCCPKCWNVDDNNRNGKSFHCTVCNHKDDADHNASENIAYRATDEEVTAIAEQYAYSTYKRHKALKELFAERHRHYLKSFQVVI